MLYCTKCEKYVPEDEEITHVIEDHPTIYKELLQDWANMNMFECERFDPREEALTVGERNPTLR